ncbi:hypothetical protein B0T21DRAFT_395781 [Apiosordaria backusii]|uniref:Uncharacterized protein n=1 Tax=Apiosordaria backusii TaxID=314023 RepID=A0AA40AMX4_9PEZI|nr:hypothetical protein B0T21DRAFT_395781 [Apiosordaria backusii]
MMHEGEYLVVMPDRGFREYQHTTGQVVVLGWEGWMDAILRERNDQLLVAGSGQNVSGFEFECFEWGGGVVDHLPRWPPHDSAKKKGSPADLRDKAWGRSSWPVRQRNASGMWFGADVDFYESGGRFVTSLMMRWLFECGGGSDEAGCLGEEITTPLSVKRQMMG